MTTRHISKKSKQDKSTTTPATTMTTNHKINTSGTFTSSTIPATSCSASLLTSSSSMMTNRHKNHHSISTGTLSTYSNNSSRASSPCSCSSSYCFYDHSNNTSNSGSNMTRIAPTESIPPRSSVVTNNNRMDHDVDHGFDDYQNNQEENANANANANAIQNYNNDEQLQQQQQYEYSVESLLPSYLSGLVEHSHDDFFISPFFDPILIVQLMSEGFLPISTSRYLLPKLHKERCVIYPLQQQSTTISLSSSSSTIHTSKSTKKKLKRFSFSINQNFDGVVKGCHNQHGIAWLYPDIVASFRYIHNLSKKKKDTTGNDAGSGSGGVTARIIMPSIFHDTCNNNNSAKTLCHVKLYSIEVWNEETGELAGGELGYTVGTIYTSLTGFSHQDSAGSVQLACLGKLLIKSGYEMWDLGMSLDYKITLGAKNLNRIEFLERVRELRVKEPNEVKDGGVELSCDERVNCKDMFNEC